jgi:hypothetical protein
VGPVWVVLATTCHSSFRLLYCFNLRRWRPLVSWLWLVCIAVTVVVVIVTPPLPFILRVNQHCS